MANNRTRISRGPVLARARRLRLPLLALVGLSFVLSGCLSSNFAFVSFRASDGVSLYFKVPTSWTTYSDKQIIQAENGKLSQSQINQIANGQWLTTFSGSRKATAKTLLPFTANFPSGVALTRPVQGTERDQLSFAAMRAELLGSDPLAAQTNSPFNVISYSEFTLPGSIRGSKLVTDIAQSNGSTSTFAQIVDVDPNSNRLFAIGVTCRASCWGPNQGLINQVLGSWKVKEIAR